jgi:hypothetical protein
MAPEGEIKVTPLDWYILFAIGFFILALWVVYAAEAARRRLRESAQEDSDSPDADSDSREGGGR